MAAANIYGPWSDVSGSPLERHENWIKFNEDNIEELSQQVGPEVTKQMKMLTRNYKDGSVGGFLMWGTDIKPSQTILCSHEQAVERRDALSSQTEKLLFWEYFGLYFMQQQRPAIMIKQEAFLKEKKKAEILKYKADVKLAMEKVDMAYSKPCKVYRGVGRFPQSPRWADHPSYEKQNAVKAKDRPFATKPKDLMKFD